MKYNFQISKSHSFPLFPFTIPSKNQRLLSVSESSYHERLYLSVGQVHRNVRFCPKQIKIDVLWHLPEK